MVEGLPGGEVSICIRSIELVGTVGAAFALGHLVLDKYNSVAGPAIYFCK